MTERKGGVTKFSDQIRKSYPSRKKDKGTGKAMILKIKTRKCTLRKREGIRK